MKKGIDYQPCDEWSIYTLTSKQLEIHTPKRNRGRRRLNRIKKAMRTLAEVSKLQIEKKKRVFRTGSKGEESKSPNIISSRKGSNGPAVPFQEAYDLISERGRQAVGCLRSSAEPAPAAPFCG